MKEQLKNAYLEYFNDFFTVEKFAEYHGIETIDAVLIIRMGKKYHESELKQKESASDIKKHLNNLKGE